mmetsp:Transcript_23282/g.52850  ORF Transcript_23282/g.52850 Transcript_23282/m.52850 type:complete len:213 (-) Transcript_23282:436-1074(-)
MSSPPHLTRRPPPSCPGTWGSSWAGGARTMGDAPTSRATASNESSTSGTMSAGRTAGHPFLNTPPFSRAINPSVAPSKSVWSRAMAPTTLTREEEQTLVASSRPPTPTSTTATSTLAVASWSHMAAVVASKAVTVPAATSAPPAASRIASTDAAHPRGSGDPSMVTASDAWRRCGEENVPTRTPAERRAAATMAQMLPLPFVPATCTTRSVS